eukprot:Nitzschia sp. Nitz4//scaffold14_size191712//36133//38490//NITZ4_001703-RA/size191712-processed-gene-0.260-mRNA-1//1//CDS//3329536867//5268//frame0
MMAAPETPRSKRRGSLLQGARAMLGRASSNPKLDAPETPKTHKSKKVSSDESLNTSRRSKSPVKNRTALREPDCPSTPQANRKVRRNSLGGSGHRNSETTTTLNDSEQKVSPTPSSKSKSKRRKSLGAMVSDDTSSKSRSLKSPKPKKKSSRDSASSESKKTPLKGSSNHKVELNGSMNDLLVHLGDEPLPEHRSTKKKREPSSPKSRSTVDRDGRIRRVKKKSDGNDSDGEDAKSTSSKRSKGSVKSLGSKKVKKVRDKVKVPRRASLAAVVPSPRAMGNDSEHSDRGNRVSRADVSARSSERRAGRRVLSLDGAGNLASPLPDAKSLISHTSEITTDTNSLSNVEFSSLTSPTNDINKLTDQELRVRVVELEKQLTNVKEEHLKAQFDAQTEAAKLRKDLREEKLELQRSQTERRELRAELKEREALLDLSDRKIEALEKAVESQLDKVDDLEEELRRANEEVFYMEEKLAQAELDLVDSSAAEVQGREKELALGDELRERTERRLVERERALEAREKKLREERDAMLLSSQPQRDVDRLEQDNRMLLKALNREKEEAAEKQQHMQKTIDELKNTLVMSKNGSDGGLAELLQEKLALQEELDAVREEAREKATAVENNSGSPRAGMNGGSYDESRELEAVKAELEVLKSKNEASQRRNQLLEEDIDHWKSVNCNLEDELVEWKSQANNWRAKYENVADAEHLDDSQDLASGMLPYHVPRGDSQSVKDHRDMEETASVASEPANSIASLWSKLTTPSSRRPSMSSQQGMDPEAVRAVLARSTFH